MSRLPTFSPTGRGHMALAVAEHGPVTFADFCMAANVPGAGKDRMKLHFAVKALVEVGFLRFQVPDGYLATEAGLSALRRLRAGESVVADEPRPNCRIFVRKEAA